MKKPTLRLLKSLEKTGKKFWCISRETGQFLNLLVRDRGHKCALEIGSGSGYSGIWLAEALTHNQGHLYTMESNKKLRLPLAAKNFAKSGLKNITLIAGHAPEDLPKKPRTFDLAFFDATKYEHIDYFLALKNRIKRGGMIITDNALSHEKELAAYKKAIISDKNWQTTLLGLGTGLLLSLRK